MKTSERIFGRLARPSRSIQSVWCVESGSKTGLPTRHLLGFVWRFVAILLALSVEAQAQWLSQSFTLRPGWNAIYTHVDASYIDLDHLLTDANGPIADIWLWKPSFSSAQFISDPTTASTIQTANSPWSVWTSNRADTDTLTGLVGNSAYLVNNRSASDYVWTVRGRPVPPSYLWTVSGLNLIGFPTPSAAAPSMSKYLAPVPGLDLAKSLQNLAHVFWYPGGDLGANNPTEIVSFNASVAPVTRGRAFWVRGNTNYYNHYYGPVEVNASDVAGIQYGDSRGTASLRLKNITTKPTTVTLALLDSEPAPDGQPPVVATPQLLIRGNMNPTTLAYDYAVLAGQSITLSPQGQPGSEVQVILGLNRSQMVAPEGSTYAGTLRITDSNGLQQTDLPVVATVPNSSGLWIGSASVNQVGQYLKSYPRVDASQANQSALINAAAARARLPANGNEMPGATWIPRETSFARSYSSVASSLDGRRLIAAVSPGGLLYVSQDYGASWSPREAPRDWAALTISADGTVMMAAAFNGSIRLSSDSGTTWADTPSGNGGWSSLAASADGRTLAAVQSGGSLFLSTDRGGSWRAMAAAGIRNWSSITVSADGTVIVAAVNPGQIHVSTDQGMNWQVRASVAGWTAVASSADGTRLLAASWGGTLFTSTDSGGTWTPRALAAGWTAAASSTDGRRLAASVSGGQIYTSSDFGVTWVASDQNRAWDSVVSSGDGTRLVAVERPGSIYTLNRRFASYTVDPASGVVRDQDGVNLSSGVNTNMARVPMPFPLRLILHNDPVSNQVRLFQRVFVGPGNTTNSTVVATQESLLDANQLASARRISATHLPFSADNSPWSTIGSLNPGVAVTFTVPLSYKDHASNPYLHTFHPDHDNLDAGFKNVLPRGMESYDVTRTITLTFNPPGTDFASLTDAAKSRGGTYQETMTIGGPNGSSRDFRLSGSFNLNLITPVSTVTTP